jgi:hypothetical protein
MEFYEFNSVTEFMEHPLHDLFDQGEWAFFTSCSPEGVTNRELIIEYELWYMGKKIGFAYASVDVDSISMSICWL